LVVIEYAVRLTHLENWDNPEEPQDEVCHHREVVEILRVYDLIAESVLAWQFAPKKAPVHINVPCIGIG
jgi:hypothetical protein